MNKFSQYPLRLLGNEDTCILFYETNEPSIFNAPKTYDVLHATGSLNEGYTAAFQHITVTDEGIPLFEKQFLDIADMIKDAPGISAIRILRPKRSNTYIILTLWENEQSYQTFHQSDEMMNLSAETNWFSKQPYVKKYFPISIEE